MGITPERFVELSRECFESSQKNGWYESELDFYTQLNHVVSEISEAFESYRRNEPKYYFKDRKPEGCVVELLDAAIIIMSINYFDLNQNDTQMLDYVVPKFNRYFKYTDIDKKDDFNIELANLSKSVLTSDYFTDLLADSVYIIKYLEFNGFDCEMLMLRKLEYNKTRGYKHGNKRF